jgi:hypothetical protein
LATRFFFGESAFLLPCAVFLYAWLRWHGANAVARHWLIAFSLTACLVLVSKLAFMGWGIGSAALNFTGFSGHAMMAASILPVFACLAVPSRYRTLSLLAAVAGVLLALAVGMSRLALHAHSMSEVVSGLALGFCVSLPFIMRHEVPHGPVAMLLASGVLATVLVLPVSGVAGVTHIWVQGIATFFLAVTDPTSVASGPGKRTAASARSTSPHGRIARPGVAPADAIQVAGA